MPKRLLQVLVLLFAVTALLGAGSPDTRFDKLGHQLMCTCGCGEILLECNHMGCPDSPGLIRDLRTQLSGGNTNGNILKWFADQYGATVLAAPIRGGFDVVAWIMPFAVLALGILAVTWLMRHWRDRHMAAHAAQGQMPATLHPATQSEMQERIRRETDFEA